ncbi:unnamed protein product, partial [Porites lobata]
MEYQVKLEEKYRKAFMDLSLSDTIYQEIRRCGGNSFCSEKRGGPGSSPWKMCNFKSSVDYDEDAGYLFELPGWKNLARQHEIEKATMVSKSLHRLAPEYLSS